MAAHRTSVMKTIAFLGAAGAFAMGAWFSRPSADHPPLAVIAPQGKDARSTALFIVGAEGWQPEYAARAARLAEMHTLVIGIDGPAVFSQSEDCSGFAEALLLTAKHVQADVGAFARAPVLTGHGDGSRYAVNAAWALPDRFKGLVTHASPTALPDCEGMTATSGALPPKAPLRWLDIVETDAASAVKDLAGVTVVEPKDPQRSPFYQSYLRLAGTDSAFDLDTASASADLADLPLTLHQDPNATNTETYAIFLSGDGGWANFDEEISDRLAAQGIPVVGISSLKYMWRAKTPAQIAADLSRIDAHYREHFKAKRVALIGFSLGANTLPFAVAELPDRFRNQIAGVGLIAPEEHTGFEIVIGGWLGQKTGAIEVAPAIDTLAQQLPPNRILCIRGQKETVSACPIVANNSVQHVSFAGGHHMGKDHAGVTQALIEQLKLITEQHAAR
ncbi:hypothetical protein GG681_17185 [Epibacterium sp. SM1969]|uniref:Bacterial virulence domain-containing protein n=2 Tax=Tritonibacter aquimaris TaxID=2663379 RepID=A0A844AP20_9RHOB|nr:hypothetical protein [Tritonibacter aquimaris]